MKIKKTVAFLISFIMMLNVLVLPSYAKDTGAKTDYPFIFVHGMGGWAPNDPFYEISPYWGGGLGTSADTDFVEILNDKGYEVYAPSVGPLSSAWDRACEIYAQLTGTVVDYGAAHSEKHNHDRYGYSYEGRAIMGEPWNMEEKLNLVGHSFGAPTIRLLTSLLAYGNAEEIAATGDETSNLFKGGYDNVIHSCTTLAGTNNGSSVANYIYDAKPLFYAISLMLNFAGATLGDYVVFSLQLGHFGIGPKQNEEKAKFDFGTIYDFYKAEDNCGYDMTLRGARELNESIKLSPNTYYYSYTTAVTQKGVITGLQIPVKTTNPIFYISSMMIAATEGKTIDGIKMEGNWVVNDGIVPLASALYPLSDADTAKNYEESIEAGEEIESGRWYYMKTIFGMDHFDFCGIKDYPTTAEDFYVDMINLVNSR